jgi:hypothetical protein
LGICSVTACTLAGIGATTSCDGEDDPTDQQQRANRDYYQDTSVGESTTCSGGSLEHALLALSGLAGQLGPTETFGSGRVGGGLRVLDKILGVLAQASNVPSLDEVEERENRNSQEGCDSGYCTYLLKDFHKGARRGILVALSQGDPPGPDLLTRRGSSS